MLSRIPPGHRPHKKKRVRRKTGHKLLCTLAPKRSFPGFVRIRSYCVECPIGDRLLLPLMLLMVLLLRLCSSSFHSTVPAITSSALRAITLLFQPSLRRLSDRSRHSSRRLRPLPRRKPLIVAFNSVNPPPPPPFPPPPKTPILILFLIVSTISYCPETPPPLLKTPDRRTT